MVNIEFEGKYYSYEDNTTYETISRDFADRYDSRILLAVADGKIKELFKRVKKDCRLEFLTQRDKPGQEVYTRTAIMMLVRAVSDLAGMEAAARVKVEYAIGRGEYISLDNYKVDEEFVRKVKARMQELSEQNLPITKKLYHISEAEEIFRRESLEDKIKLIQYRNSSYINLYELGGYYDYFYGYMLPSTGYMDCFDLQPYAMGFMLLLSSRKNPHGVEVFEEKEKLFTELERSTYWGSQLNIETVGDLNEQICTGGMYNLILVQEAMQERRIAEIAKSIAERKDVKFVMIAGPSSSGKTSFSYRLSIQLKSYGLRPHPIALDDYYVDREKTPIDENGKYDFECLEAVDVEQFNQDMTRLLSGETVELPSFNFKTGKREYRGNYKTLGPEDVLVIEGIHGLNDRTSYSLPVESKFKIYISALTCLNIDRHNRISITDARLLRRMVRDARTRNTPAKKTIEMWPSVRRGEENNIFPFQESADVMFNSVLIYELSVLKQYAEPLLHQISPDEPEYAEAKKLLKFLGYFLGVSSEEVPHNSIVREFIGGSIFNV